MPLSTKQCEYLALAWQCMDTEPKIDYEKFRQIAGLASAHSARELMRVTKKKLREEYGASLGADKTASTPTTPRKTTSQTTTPRKKTATRTSQTPTKTPSSKKRSRNDDASAEDDVDGDDDDDDDDNEKPTRNGASAGGALSERNGNSESPTKMIKTAHRAPQFAQTPTQPLVKSEPIRDFFARPVPTALGYDDELLPFE